MGNGQGRTPSVAEPVQATVVWRVALPARQPGHVEVSIPRVEAPLLRA